MKTEKNIDGLSMKGDEFDPHNIYMVLELKCGNTYSLLVKPYLYCGVIVLES